MKNLNRPSGWISAFLLGVTLAACSPSGQTAGGSAPNQAIVNGTAVTRLSTLSSRLVFILIKDNSDNSYSSCSGSLLPGNIVLTAAHCVPDANSTVVVGFGANVSVSAATLSSPSMHKVIARRRQSAYDTDVRETKLASDVGLLKFSGAVPESAAAFALPFGEGAVQADPTDSVYMIGYGFSSPTEARVGTLQFLKVALSRVLNLSSGDPYVSIDGSSAGLCMGDSGSPLAFYQGDTPVIWAVASSNQANNSVPADACKGTDYFTRISAQATWLESNYNDLIKGN